MSRNPEPLDVRSWMQCGLQRDWSFLILTSVKTINEWLGRPDRLLSPQVHEMIVITMKRPQNIVVMELRDVWGRWKRLARLIDDTGLRVIILEGVLLPDKLCKWES